jgi:hypothetical protein
MIVRQRLSITGAVVAFGVIIAAVALALWSTNSSAAIYPSAIDVQPASDGGTGHRGSASMLMPTYDLDNVGREATPSEVTASSNLGQPRYLPSGTSLSKAKLIDGGSLGVLIYTNPELDRIRFYRQDVQLVIIAQRDGTSLESFERVLATENHQTLTIIDKDGNQHTENLPVEWVVTNRSRPVSVGGIPGYGYDPIYTPVQDNGEVQWWTDGIHYEVIANLPVQELVKIAESIPRG